MAENKLSTVPRIKVATVYNKQTTFNDENTTSITFPIPSDFHKSLGVKVSQFWPTTTWSPRTSFGYDIVRDATFSGSGEIVLHVSLLQAYHVILQLVYI